MEHHRRCEACDKCRKDTHIKHPYLKRRSKSYNLNNAATKSSESINSQTACINPSRTDSKSEREMDSHVCDSAPTDHVQQASQANVSNAKDGVEDSIATLVNEARAQLAAPCVAPKELTDGEKGDKDDASAWANTFEARERQIAELSARTDRLYLEVMEGADEHSAQKASVGPSQHVEASDPPSLTEHEPLLSSSNEVQSQLRDTTSSAAVAATEATSPPSEASTPAKGQHSRTDKLISTPTAAAITTATPKRIYTPKKDGWITLWSFDAKKTW